MGYTSSQPRSNGIVKKGSNMTLRKVASVLFLLALSGIAYGQHEGPSLGSCDTGAGREHRKIQYIADSVAQTQAGIEGREPCTNRAHTVKRCAVIKIGDEKIQHYCHGAGKPTYYEDVEVIEYWEKAEH